MIDVKELQMVTTNDSKTKKIQLTVKPDSIRMPKYQSKKAPVVCPRSAEDVYALGISLQKYISSLYVELAEMNKGRKNPYTNMVLKQLVIKRKLEELSRENLNGLLAYFYNNGGPIIEPPVSEQLAAEIQPSVNSIVSGFLTQANLLINRAVEGDLKADDLETEIDDQVMSMYTAMGRIFQNDDMQKAFEQLINVRGI
ncbi:MAG TPA: hypothetical protein DER33_06745 [Syntrophomonas sp.]|jgi:hypothetical protein|nr:hypothetical protein [Syntrophomonas sp.]